MAVAQRQRQRQQAPAARCRARLESQPPDAARVTVAERGAGGATPRCRGSGRESCMLEVQLGRGVAVAAKRFC
jgi:hypothetical protein